MSKDRVTTATQQFIWIMRGFSLIYFLGGVFFFFAPEKLFYLINVGPKVFGLYEEIPLSAERFWITLSASMMAMLCLTSFYSSLYPHMKSFVFLHLLEKIVSISGFMFLFFHGQHYFAYPLSAIIDSLVIVIVLFFFLRKKPLEDQQQSTLSAL